MLFSRPEIVVHLTTIAGPWHFGRVLVYYMSTRWCELESSTKCFLFLSTFFDTPITTYLLNAVGMCLSYAKGIYHINIEFILNGSKISLSSKEHK